MNMEELTKSQIVLLTLLVSFVTSIATGIVTVSLLDQAPPEITQSVSRIIRETVQSAVPAVITQSATVAATPPKDPPIAPDLPQIIAGSQRSIVRLYGGTDDAPIFLGLAVELDTNGTIVTDYDALGELESANAVFANGSSTPLSLVTRDTSKGLAYLSPTSTSSSARFTPASLSNGQQPVGESVIALSGKKELRIASGLIVAEESQSSPAMITTNISAASIIKGTPLINARGQFLGISTGASRSEDPAAFMPIAVPIPGSKQATAAP